MTQEKSETVFMSKKPFEKDATNLNADLNWHDTVPGALLRRLRKDRGFSLVRLESLSGVSDSEIHRVETGQQDCSIQSLVRLCAALGTTPGYMLDRALASKRTEIQKRIIADSDFAALRERLTFATPQQMASLTNAIIEACQAFSVLLRCSAPASFVKNFQFRPAQWQSAFVDFAARIAAIGEGVDRASMIYGLLSNPLRELKSQGLLPEFLLTPDGLAALPHGAPDGWDTNAIPQPGDTFSNHPKPGRNRHNQANSPRQPITP